MKRPHVILWLPCVLYYLLITALSHIPGNDFDVVLPFEHVDKVAHFLMYTFLGLIVSRALSWEKRYHRLRKHGHFYFLLIVVLAAFIDEGHQHFVPFRQMDFFDALADVGGAVVGGRIYFYIRRSRGRFWTGL